MRVSCRTYRTVAQVFGFLLCYSRECLAYIAVYYIHGCLLQAAVDAADVACGLSLGEYTALTYAKAIR